MSSIINEWENARLAYQQRYVQYLRKFNETGDAETRGQLNECSHVLIDIFGLTVKQIKEIEHNYSGFTNDDISR